MLTEVCADLLNDDGEFAGKRESKAGTSMAEMITKSNTLRRTQTTNVLNLKTFKQSRSKRKGDSEISNSSPSVSVIINK